MNNTLKSNLLLTKGVDDLLKLTKWLETKLPKATILEVDNITFRIHIQHDHRDYSDKFVDGIFNIMYVKDRLDLGY